MESLEIERERESESERKGILSGMLWNLKNSEKEKAMEDYNNN